MTFWSNKRLLLWLSVAFITLVAVRLLTHNGLDLGNYYSSSGRAGYLDLEQTPSDRQEEKNQRMKEEYGLKGPIRDDVLTDSILAERDKVQEQEEVQDQKVLLPLSSALEVIPERMRIKVGSYVKTILDPYDSTFTGLKCPRVNATRYAHLQPAESTKRGHVHELHYFFALDLRQVVDLLPRLLGSIVEAMRFLGPQYCAISIVEGHSDDGTREVLEILEPELEALGVTSFFLNAEINPAREDRIGNLARLRSVALEPLKNSRNGTARFLGLPGSKTRYSDDATVIFLNDVAACPEDILELLHQRIVQEADMTCAMDWHHPADKKGQSLFYDVWISRALSGNLFFDIPTSGSWENAKTLFPFDPTAGARYAAHRPFQVFACWNGAVTFTAKPILNHELDFRKPYEAECFQGEPDTFCKDMWWNGYGRIAVVPSVNLEYTDVKGTWIKEEKGFVYEWAAMEDEMGEGTLPLMIEWEGPPDLVKCMPGFERQSWLPWNESLSI